MFRKVTSRFSMRRLRKILRGHRILKKTNSLDKISAIKDLLAVTDCAKSKLMSPIILGAAISNSELVLRQYLLYHFANYDLNKAILYAKGNSDASIVHPLPHIWFSAFEQSGLKIAKVRSTLLWNGYIIMFFALGLKVIGKTIIQSIKEIIRPAYNGLGRYTYFDSISVDNLHNSKGRYSRTILSWYQQWSGRVGELDTICHDIQGLNPTNSGAVCVRSLLSAIPPINTINGLVRYTAWAIKSILLAGIDLFRGRWWHALLLNQAARSAHVRIMSADLLAREYMFHNANWIYRPLWTYEAEARECLVTFYFYSTNCESFKLRSGYSKQIYGWQNLNWPRYLVWNDYQSSFVKRVIGEGAPVKVVGCIWFSDNGNNFSSTTKHNIAVFNVTPQRLSHYAPQVIQDFHFYSPKVCNKFLLDIQQTSFEQQYNMLLKQKRNIGSMAHPSYRLICESLLSLQNVRCVDADTSAIQVIEECDLVISMPFTSTALIAREMNKPSVYYDPLGLCQKGDRAAHGIEILQGKNELESWILAQG